MRPLRIVLLYFQSAANSTLSYQLGWPQALAGSPHFACRAFNLADRCLTDTVGFLKDLYADRPDAVVMLHSVFSNQNFLRRGLFWAVAASPAPKVYFIGNEYKAMPEKMAFSRRLGLALFITQSNDPEVLQLYRQALGCPVESIPNTGFDPAVFRPSAPLAGRPIDIGYRSFPGPWYLGNREKEEIAEYFQLHAKDLGLRAEISMSTEDRFDPPGYAAFMNRCRGQIGTESGGDYFDLGDETRNRVNAYQKAHPQAGWDEVRATFFDKIPTGVKMRIISGRQVEAAACKTAQVLFEGDYNGYLVADEHYIPLAKDFGNVDEVMRKFRDDAFCQRMVDNAYDVAMSEFTYDSLTARFAAMLRQAI